MKLSSEYVKIGGCQAVLRVSCGRRKAAQESGSSPPKQLRVKYKYLNNPRIMEFQGSFDVSGRPVEESVREYFPPERYEVISIEDMSPSAPKQTGQSGTGQAPGGNRQWASQVKKGSTFLGWKYVDAPNADVAREKFLEIGDELEGKLFVKVGEDLYGRPKWQEVSQQASAPVEKSPKVSYHVIVTRPNGKKVEYNLKGTKVKLDRVIADTNAKEGYTVEVKDESFGHHYQVTVIDKKTKKPWTSIVHGDKDKLAKGLEARGYTVEKMDEIKIPAQPRNYNIFEDPQVVKLLKEKKIPQEVIQKLQSYKIRGAAPVVKETASTQASRGVRERVQRSPYYITFSDN